MSLYGSRTTGLTQLILSIEQNKFHAIIMIYIVAEEENLY
jgi:hypothetical protein